MHVQFHHPQKMIENHDHIRASCKLFHNKFNGNKLDFIVPK